jgi:hypothetical protein
LVEKCRLPTKNVDTSEDHMSARHSKIHLNRWRTLVAAPNISARPAQVGRRGRSQPDSLCPALRSCRRTSAPRDASRRHRRSIHRPTHHRLVLCSALIDGSHLSRTYVCIGTWTRSSGRRLPGRRIIRCKKKMNTAVLRQPRPVGRAARQ